jgi:hypothetical protein
MSYVNKFLKNKKGSAVVFAMFTVLVIAIAIGAIITYTISYARYVQHTIDKKQAYCVAESAINAVESIWAYYGFPMQGGYHRSQHWNNMQIDVNNDGNFAHIVTTYYDAGHNAIPLDDPTIGDPPDKPDRYDTARIVYASIVSTSQISGVTATITAEYQWFNRGDYALQSVGYRRIGWQVSYS